LPARTDCADSNECIEKANPKEQKPSPVDNLAAENTIQAQTLLHNKKDENKIAENSLPERKTQSIFDEALRISGRKESLKTLLKHWIMPTL